MDAERFDLAVRSCFAPRSRRSVLGLALGGIGLSGVVNAAIGKKRRKKGKKRPSCACADNEACINQRCVSLARICVAENDSCLTGEHLLCGAESDPPLERASCQRTLGGNPICVRMRSVWCRPCTGPDDCQRQGWGPRGVCLATCRIRCGEGGPPSCGLPYGEPCRAPGESCIQDADCCSDLCDGGLCRLAPPFCGGPGALCKERLECCAGTCGWPVDPYCSS